MPCMKYCLPVKNLKCIAKLWIFGITCDKFKAVENCENDGQKYTKRIIIKSRVSANLTVQSKIF